MFNVGTHNGPFHADETLACAVLLALALKQGGGYEVVRTRDPKVLETCGIVVDVGGVYDNDKCRFDHHQIEGKPVDRENGVPFSSAGLVWKHFGRDLVSCNEVHKLVDEKLFQAVDSLDNGYGERNIVAGLEHVTFSDVVSGFNPTWQEDTSPAAFDARFTDATKFAMAVLNRTIAECEAAFAAQSLVTSQKGESVIVIDRYAPVMDTIIETSATAQFLVYPSPGGEWMIQCVPPAKGSFAQRKPLPAEWAGKRGKDLDAVTGEDGGIFCHAGRFIAGASTKEQAIRLAQMAL
jgi:uncharacterized UPF0160 family protein